MPTFGFAPAEAAKIALALASIRKADLPASYVVKQAAARALSPARHVRRAGDAVPLPELPQRRRLRRRPLHRAARSHRQPAPARLPRDVPAEPGRRARERRGAHAGVPHAAGRGEDDRRLLLDGLPRRRPRPVRHAASRRPRCGAARSSTASSGAPAATSSGPQGGYVGPDLSNTGAPAEAGLDRRVARRRRRRYKPGTLQPDYGLSPARRAGADGLPVQPGREARAGATAEAEARARTATHDSSHSRLVLVRRSRRAAAAAAAAAARRSDARRASAPRSGRRSLTYAESQGKQLFDQYCATCHGDEGQGRRPERVEPEPAAPDLTASKTVDDARYVRRVIAEGSAAVGRSPLSPPWGRSLSPQEIEYLVAYCQALGRQRSTDGRPRWD